MNPLVVDFLSSHPREAVTTCNEAPIEDVIQLFAQRSESGGLPVETAVNLLAVLPGSLQKRILDALSADRFTILLAANVFPAITILVAALSAAKKKQLADAAGDLVVLKRLHEMEQGMVAQLMDNRFITVNEHSTPEQAIQMLKDASEDLPLFAVDQLGRYRGQVSAGRLLAANERDTVADLMVDVPGISFHADLDQLDEMEAWHQTTVLAVTNKKDIVVGALYRSSLAELTPQPRLTAGEAVFTLVSDYVRVTAELTDLALGSRK